MAEVVEQTLALCEATTTMIRTISSVLHPALLEQSGLVATLRWYAESLSNRTGVRVQTRLPAQNYRTDPEVEISLFRLTQEWLNAMFLRGDLSATVSLAVGPAGFELRIESVGPSWGKQELEDLHRGTGDLGVFVSAMGHRLRQSGGTVAFRQEDTAMVLDALVPRRSEK